MEQSELTSVTAHEQTPPRQRALQRLRHRWGAYITRVLRSFIFAGAGVCYLFRTQRNAQVHLVFAVAACALAAWLRVGTTQWAILALTIATVLVLEAVNTAIEAAIDLASPKEHPLAKVAKDVGAAAVLLAAIGAVAVGLLILGPPLVHRLFG